jgi:putative intracellular protease/amidase
MKVLALVYPGMTLLDLVGPMQAWSFLPDYEVQYALHSPGVVPTDCGLSVEATHSFEDARADPDVVFVGGGAKPTLDLLGDSDAIAFLADRGSRARWVCSVCTGSLLLGAAGLLRGYRAAAHWGAREWKFVRESPTWRGRRVATSPGKEAVLNERLRPLASQFVDQYTATADHFIAEGDHAVVECRGRVTTKENPTTTLTVGSAVSLKAS